MEKEMRVKLINSKSCSVFMEENDITFSFYVYKGFRFICVLWAVGKCDWIYLSVKIAIKCENYEKFSYFMVEEFDVFLCKIFVHFTDQYGYIFRV